MKRFYIEYEVRNIGAVGIFWFLQDYIEATTQKEAMEKFRQKYEKQYEFRFPNRCEEVN